MSPKQNWECLTRIRLTKIKVGDKLADCFRVHTDAIIEGFPGLLCHGTVWHKDIGWHSHCWIEINNIAIDFADGHKTALLKETYYMLGFVKDVTRYTIEGAFENMNKHGHYGPWD